MESLQLLDSLGPLQSSQYATPGIADLPFDTACSVGGLLTGEVHYVQGNSDCADSAAHLGDMRSMLDEWSLHYGRHRDDKADRPFLRHLIALSSERHGSLPAQAATLALIGCA